jgi:hypothetical protein
MDTPTRNDLLASNLLFASLLLSVLGEVGILGIRIFEASHVHSPIINHLGRGLAMLLLSVLVRASLYYAVRHGILAAKLVLVLGFLLWAYTKTNWAAGRVAEVDFAHLWGYPLLVLLRQVLTLAALVLMFRKPRMLAPSGT